jgi:DNA/RNA endonuclease YhcR with UshA esterase domain
LANNNRQYLEENMRKIGLVLLIATLTFVCPAFADEKPATQPTTDATVIAISDKDALLANKDKEVIVEGTIDKADWSSSGKVLKATFKDDGGSKFSLVVFVKNREKFDQAFAGDVGKSLTGAKVRVKGKIGEYRDTPQIVLDTPDQVTVVEAAPG